VIDNDMYDDGHDRMVLVVDDDDDVYMVDGDDKDYHSFYSSITIGESDDLRKSSDADLFLLSGSSVATGYAHMLVTAVGVQSRYDDDDLIMVIMTMLISSYDDDSDNNGDDTDDVDDDYASIDGARLKLS